jgi:hypothetical protein
MTMIIDGTNGLTFNNATTQASAGTVLQVVQTVSTTQQTINSSSFVELTSLNTSITPKFSTSKILVIININASNADDTFPAYKLFRGATWIGQASTTGSGTPATFVGGSIASTFTTASVFMNNTSFNYLDSPSTTSSTTYSVQVSPMRTGARNYALNRAVTISDANQITAISTITLMEIAA